MCDDRTAKQNMACVGVCACDRMPLTARPDIDKLDDTVNEYNNTYHKAIKMKPVDVISLTYIHILTQQNCTLIRRLMIKILNLKLVIM